MLVVFFSFFFYLELLLCIKILLTRYTYIATVSNKVEFDQI